MLCLEYAVVCILLDVINAVVSRSDKCGVLLVALVCAGYIESKINLQPHHKKLHLLLYALLLFLAFHCSKNTYLYSNPG